LWNTPARCWGHPDMDGSLMASKVVAKQRTDPRFGSIVREATPLPFEVLNTSLVDCFERQAACHAERLAVQAVEGPLTYAALNAAANSLAHQLLVIGVDANAPVAIILERSLDAVVSMLAVLKTGGYFLYLEPGLPTQRLVEILNLAAARLILTTSAHKSQIEPARPDNATIVWLDQMPTSELAHNPGIEINPAQPARLGFTSGSTGAPKLIISTHQRQLYSAWQSINAYLFSPQDRHAFVYQFSAGPSMRAMFSALLTGGSLHLDSTPSYDMNGLAAWIDAQAITQFYLPTVAFRELLHALTGGDNLPSVRMVFVGGQTIYRQDAELFQRHFAQGSILVCRFSMSETSGLAHFLVDHTTVLEDDILPAGYALSGRELLIVDEQGRPLGFDQPGEIAVRQLLPNEPLADNLANGIEIDQGAGNGAAPIFRTADLGLLRPDGCLIHLGRKDDMVKVRGNRVALAEAERLLLSVAGVAQAAIKPFPTSSGDNRLAGYVTPEPGAQLTVADIREEMNRLAPAYMVPTRFIVLPALPLTPSGKIDRQTLPPPGRARPELATPFAPPRTELEQQIADIWADLLELDEVGIDDNFFELGGDSLTAMGMTLEVERLAARVPPDFFRNPTIARLADMLQNQAASSKLNLPMISDRTALVNRTVHQANPWPRRLGRLLTGQVKPDIALRWLIPQIALRLDYFQGLRWLAWLSRQPAASHRLYRHERDLFYRFAETLGHPATNPENAFQVSILSNIIRSAYHQWLARALPPHDNLLRANETSRYRFWRSFATLVNESFERERYRLIVLAGLDHLHRAQDQGRGTILVTYHSSATHVAKYVVPLVANTGPILTISQADASRLVAAEQPEPGATFEIRKSARSATLGVQGRQLLRTGGTVLIVSDWAHDKTGTLSVSMGGRLYDLKPGFAELALMTGAIVLPMYNAHESTGRMHTTFLPPLDAIRSNGSHAAQVSDLMDQYAQFVGSTWRMIPESIDWPIMRNYFNRPLVKPDVLP
jgi:acyl-coenzyme A synthetase/AMP-(fatty) acid ligase/lauroyl/myristoyl acyltransferase/acyl carrier protein